MGANLDLWGMPDPEPDRPRAVYIRRVVFCLAVGAVILWALAEAVAV